MLDYLTIPVALEKRSIHQGMVSSAHYAHGLILDIGCGEKPYASVFEGPGKRYFGLDIDIGNNKKVDICGSSLHLPIKDSSVDTVITNQTIEHVKSPEKFMEEISRILTSGGTLILTAPQLWCLHEVPNDYYRFTRFALELLCQRNRLDVVLLRERFGAYATIGQMISLMIYLPNSKSWLRRQIVRPLFAAVQLIFLLLDKLFYNPDLTLGYILVASKGRERPDGPDHVSLNETRSR